jgi:hypothetical protein
MILTSLSTPATGDAAIFALLTLALAAGWTVPASSNGVVQVPVPDYTANGNLIATAADLSTGGAWFRLKMPGATRELLFVRKANAQSWTVSYGVAGFLTGAPAVLTPPTGASQRTLIDGTLLGADGAYRWLVSFDDAAPYELWAAGHTIGTLTPNGGIALLAMETGSYASADTDPYVAYAKSGSVFARDALGGNVNAGPCFSGLFGATWSSAPFAHPVIDGAYGAYTFVANSGRMSSVSAQEVPIDIPCVNGTYGHKGRVRGAKYAGSLVATAPWGTHLTDGNTAYWVRVGDLWLQWDVTVPAL